MEAEMASIYARYIGANKGRPDKWGYARVGRGKPPQSATFHIRFTDAEGRRRWSSPYASVQSAKGDAEGTAIAVNAQSAGLTIAEFSDATAVGKTFVKAAVDSFLKYHRNARPKTVTQYAGALGHLLRHLPKGVRFVGDLATEDALDSYHATLQTEGFAPKTIWVRMGVIFSMLKRNATETGVTEPSTLVKLTKPVEKEAVAYTAEDLEALFEKMDEEEKVRYTFFLATACREQEVMYTTWSDLDLTNKTFKVTGEGKQDVGFVPKSHQVRTIPLTSKLVAMLEARKKSAPHRRWVFVSDNGKPDGHMLRKLKSIAKAAGLNCGECETEITEWHCGTSKKVEASCLTRPVCEKHYLHRLRKTCATRWLHQGIDLRKIQQWLGHKSLAVTQLYLEGSTIVDAGLQTKLDQAGA